MYGEKGQARTLTNLYNFILENLDATRFLACSSLRIRQLTAARGAVDAPQRLQRDRCQPAGSRRRRGERCGGEGDLGHSSGHCWHDGEGPCSGQGLQREEHFP